MKSSPILHLKIGPALAQFHFLFSFYLFSAQHKYGPRIWSAAWALYFDHERDSEKSTVMQIILSNTQTSFELLRS